MGSTSQSVHHLRTRERCEAPPDLAHVAHVDWATSSTRKVVPRPAWRRKLGDRGSEPGLSQHSYTGNCRRDLLEQFEPLTTQSIFKRTEPGSIASRSSETIDETCADRIRNNRKHDGYGTCSLQQRSKPHAPVASMTSGESATSSTACLRISSELPPP